MRSSSFFSTDQYRRGFIYGGLVLLTGLSLLVEAAAAYPELTLSCVDMCTGVCKSFGLWTATDSCTAAPYEKSVRVDFVKFHSEVDADGSTRSRITMMNEGDKKVVSPIDKFFVHNGAGARCECVPQDGIASTLKF